MADFANILAELATAFSAAGSVIESFVDNANFVNTITPVIVDLPLINVNHTPRLLRNTGFRRRAGTSRVVRRTTTSTTNTTAAIKRSVETTNSSPPPKRQCIDNPNIANTGIKTITCAVCLENPSENIPTSTICGHIFCEPCIKMAITQNKKCPICQKKISIKLIHPLYF